MYRINLKSIRGLLGAFTVIFAIGFLLVPASLAVYELYRSRENVERDFNHILHLQSVVMENWFQTTSSTIAGISRLSSVERRDFSRMLFDFQRITEAGKSIEAIIYADAEGNVLVDTTFGIRKPGTIRINDRTYFREAAAKRDHVSGVLISRVTTRPVVVFSHPVFLDGAFDGLVFSTIRFDAMVEMVNSTAYGETGRFYLIDRAGLSIESKAPLVEASWVFPEHLLAELEQGGLHRYTGRSGKTVVGSGVPLPARNFFIVAEIDEWETVNRFVENGIKLFLIFLCLVLLATWLFYRVYNQVDKSLQVIYEGINRLESGNYEKLDTDKLKKAPQEFFDLATTFNAMVEKIKKNNDELLYQGFHDAATGLYNRQYYQEEIRRLSTGRFDPVGVFICDLNGLKLINDTLGHQAGDELLGNAAAIIRNCFRKGDLVARIGGDEFAVLMTKATQEAMELASRRLLESSLDSRTVPGNFPLSFSFGSAWGKTSARPLSEIINEADDAMYSFKEQRREHYRRLIIDHLMSELSDRQNLRHNHMMNCENVMRSFVDYCGFPKEQAETMVLLARHHDIGFVGLAHDLSAKKESLSIEEFREVRRHPEIGYRIALLIPELKRIAEFIRVHHYWYNGSGYPPAAEDTPIPVESRIMRIVDAFVAMTMDRTYRNSVPPDKAIEELRRCAGKEFDPEWVKKFTAFMSVRNN